MTVIRTLPAAVWLAVALRAQTFTAEADPDVYFDRGIALSLGAKPAATSRLTYLADFASRKIGPLANGERLAFRLGGGVRGRILGHRNNLFGQLNLSFDQVRTKAATKREPSLRPGIGAQWFPWREKGFYALPLLSLDRGTGNRRAHPRVELRTGWQF